MLMCVECLLSLRPWRLEELEVVRCPSRPALRVGVVVLLFEAVTTVSKRASEENDWTVSQALVQFLESALSCVPW